MLFETGLCELAIENTCKLSILEAYVIVVPTKIISVEQFRPET